MHQPERCRRCAQDLDDAETVGAVRRQVFDVPIPRPAVTEHVAVQRRCRCGCVTTARFPHGVNAPAVYGPEVKAHAVYLMTAQHLPRERCVETLRELFGVQVSTGTLDNWLSEAAARLDPFVAEVTTQLRSAPFMHADETSVRSGKAALWVHVCSTALLTLLHVGRRDKATIQAGPLGDYHGTIVHDRYATYFGLGAGHVLCNAHILRSLHEITLNRTHQAWATAFITLITTTKHAADTARTAGKRRLRAGERRQIRSDWDRLAAQATALTPPPRPGRQLYGTDKDARNLAIALAKHRDLFLAYTNDLSLPFDNNQGERDLRMIKLQSKISGEFRSTTGAARYAKLRSYVSTTRKHGESVHQHLRNLFTPTGAWLPTPT
jgi:transposase